MKTNEIEILKAINDNPGTPRVELCRKFGMMTKIRIGKLLHDEMIRLSDSEKMIFEITRKGRLCLEACSVCGCNPCDCDWGN